VTVSIFADADSKYLVTRRLALAGARQMQARCITQRTSRSPHGDGQRARQAGGSVTGVVALVAVAVTSAGDIAQLAAVTARNGVAELVADHGLASIHRVNRRPFGRVNAKGAL